MTPVEQFVNENFADATDHEKIRLISSAQGYAAICLRELTEKIKSAEYPVKEGL